MAFAAHDLDLVPGEKFGHKRRDLAVDLAAHRVVADIGVNGIGKIDRRRLARQRDQPPFRREAKDLIVEQFELRMFKKLLRTGALGQ
jgi:hypothetical protein